VYGILCLLQIDYVTLEGNQLNLLSAFWSEWILLYEPRYTVKWCTRVVVKITRELTDTTRGRITVIDVLNHPHDKSTQQQVYQEPLARLVITTRNITDVTTARRAPFTYVDHLSISENSNVQHGFSGERINYQLLEPDYWDQYNSTENKSCHMILAPLMYIPTNINAAK
jgi:hypothetical protein